MRPGDGIAEILEKAAALMGGEPDAPPALYLLDASGKEIASSASRGARLEVSFALGPGGCVETRGLAAPWTARFRRLRTWRENAATVALLRKGSRDEAALARTFEFAVEAISLCLDRNFEIDSLSDALTKLFEERSILFEIGREIGEAGDLRGFCAKLAPRLAEVLAAEKVAVALRAADRPEFRLLGVHGLAEDPERSWPIGGGITGRAIERGERALLEDPSDLPADALPFEREMERCLYVAPIQAGTTGRAMGAVLAMDRRRAAGFGSEETTLLDFLAEHLGSVLTGIRGAELRREIEIARRIVEGLLPARAPEMKGVDLAGRLSPARDVGGDYYDFIPMGDGRVGIVVADVSGHSLPATLLMTSARSAFHWEVGPGRSAVEVLSRVARHLHDDLARADLFMSMALVVLDEGGELLFANAGHPPPLLRHPDGSFEELEAEGPVAGVVPGARYEESRHRLREGDSLLLYTDGIPEAARGGEMFGMERLRRALDRAAAGTAEEIVGSIFREVEAFCGGPAADDLTVVVAKARDRRVPADSRRHEEGVQ
ncbi:MAG TPA: GAF domain-containing SpoIIE family protein phosphatase [Planctomycetota bacterium]|nr:GAF domain-containing SpoIIE family protein phosphatase [Planctomycetota bacterium]